MIKNMLQAASKMMSGSKEEKVVCAKIIIDEIVAGMEPQVSGSEDIVEEVKEAPKKDARKRIPAGESKGKVTVHEGKIATIEGVDLETTMIDLDGKVMTCAEAIGKSFQRGKIL